MIRFIHAADLHLDTPFSGLEQSSKALAEKLREAPYESLAKIVDLAITEAVDFVLFSGDLYNTKRVNIKAQSLFIEQLKRLEKSDIAVFLIRGNHDFITEESETLSLPFPDNVHTYQEEVTTHVFETREKKRVAITGFSYDSQWIIDRKIKDYPNRRQDVDMQIGLLHGSLEGVQTKEGNYAPFTINELRAKDYDYWALGHIHQYQQLSKQPPVYYAGNIQGLHKNEKGERGCLLVEWTPREHTVQFVPTAPIIWDSVDVEISDIQNVPQLFETIRNEMREKQYSQDVLIHLTLRANEAYDEAIVRFVQKHEFSAELTQHLELSKVWVVSTAFLLEEVSDQQTLEKRYPKMWQKVLKQTETPDVFNELTEGIFDQIPSKYINRTSDADYRREMIEKAIAKIHLK